MYAGPAHTCVLLFGLNRYTQREVPYNSEFYASPDGVRRWYAAPTPATGL